MSIAALFLRLATQIFFNLAVVLILFFLPLDLLYRLDSWALFMPVRDIINEIPVMILLLALASAGLALGAAGTACAMLRLFFRESAARVAEGISAAFSAASLALIVLLLLRVLKIWLQTATGMSLPLSTTKFLLLALPLVIAMMLVWQSKCGFLATANKIRAGLARGNAVVLVLTVLAGSIVAAEGFDLHDFHAVKANPVSPARVGMPNVILLSIDTLTAEDMSLYGYHLPTTPRLEAFARESYVFENFFASCNWTTPSVASFLSGMYPVTSGVHNLNSYFLPGDRKKNLAQLLTDNGYQSLAVVANEAAHPLTLRISDSFSGATEPPVRRLLPTDPVFEQLLRLKNYRTYFWLRDLTRVASEGALHSLNDDRSLWPPTMVFDRAISAMSTLRQPSFVWMHVFPPHSPYLPARPFKYRFGHFKAYSTLRDYAEQRVDYLPTQQASIDQQRARYDEFILDTDAAVGNALRKLKAAGRFDDSIIIVTADHGESFTRDYLTHSGPYLHQPLIHVPLLIHLPGQVEGKRIPFYAGHVDLLATVLDLVGLPIPQWSEGESLKETLLRGKPTSNPKFSMTLGLDSRFTQPSKGTLAVMKDGWKLVRYLSTGQEELYHLESDPHERVNLAHRAPEQESRMRKLIDARLNLRR